MEVALCWPAPLLLDDRLSPGMRQGAGLWWSHSRTPLLTREFFNSSSSCLHFMLFSDVRIASLAISPTLTAFKIFFFITVFHQFNIIFFSVVSFRFVLLGFLDFLVSVDL